MKKFLCVVSLILYMLSISLISGCGSCWNKLGFGLRLYENDFFIYTVTYDSEVVGILGLTDLGREQEYLVIPKEIDGRKVVKISTDGYEKIKITEKYGSEVYAEFNSKKLKKVFITHDIAFKFNRFTVGDCPALDGFVVIPNTELFEMDKLSGELSSLGKKLYASYENSSTFRITTKANISYYYNYNLAPNDGYYWLDNYKYGEKIEYIPEKPERAGYTFLGWYKESDCINEWNFGTDTLPESKINTEGEEIYQETKLYAKWIRN